MFLINGEIKMIKKILSSCALTIILGSAVSTATFAGNENAMVAPPIHWGKSPISNPAGLYKNGKSFCSKKYIGRKTCIPGMNNTADALTFSTVEYNSDNAPANTVVTLMGTGALTSVIFTVQDTASDGKVSTVYSGPADNRVGLICNQDEKTKAVTCAPWK
jgi:hypothetical protein